MLGAIVPVPYGSMRNFYYPEAVADYIPAPEVRQMRRTNAVIERDRLFGMKTPEAEAEEIAVKEDPRRPRPRAIERSEKRAPKLDLNVLPVRATLLSWIARTHPNSEQPDRAFKMLNDAVPSTIEFYRRPIAPLVTRRQKNAQKAEVSEAETIAPAPGTSPRQVADNIYGSVTTADITTSIRALLAVKELSGALLQLPDEDVSFVDLGETKERADKLKKLGDFEFEVKIRGHDRVLRRHVRVLPEDPQEPVNRGPAPGGPAVSMNGMPSDAERMDNP